MNSTVAKDAHAELHIAHGDLSKLLAGIEGRLADPLHTSSAASLGELLTELAGVVDAHFQYEERSAMYTQLPEDKPELADPLEALRAQHKDIRHHLDQLLYVVRNPDAEVRDLDHLQKIPAQTRDLIVEIRKHEASENALLQNAFNLDVGSGD